MKDYNVNTELYQPIQTVLNTRRLDGDAQNYLNDVEDAETLYHFIWEI